MSTFGEGYGIPVDCRSIGDVVDSLEALRSPDAAATYFVCVNPHSLEMTKGDVDFRNALATAPIGVPDGIGVVWALRLLGRKVRGRITGFDMFVEINRREAARGGAVFLLGSTYPTLCAVARKLVVEFPGLQVVGTYAPSFAEVMPAGEANDVLEAIRASEPTVVWVALGAPRQERWAAANCRHITNAIVGPVGAVFSFYIGEIVRPSPRVQRLGLEWLVRLLGEPRRLWNRTLLSAPKFLFRVATRRIAGAGGRGDV